MTDTITPADAAASIETIRAEMARARDGLARIRRYGAGIRQVACVDTDLPRLLPPLLPSTRRRKAQQQADREHVAQAAQALFDAAAAVDAILNRVPDHEGLAEAVDRLKAASVRLTAASDAYYRHTLAR